MEFADLSRYTTVENGKLAPFKKLRGMKKLILNSELRVLQSDENLSYLEQLKKDGHLVVPVRRHDVFEGLTGRRYFPRRILLELTSRCNIVCRMCPRQNMTRPKIDMPVSVAKRILDEIDEYGVEYLSLHHIGESLLHPDIKEIIEYVSKKKNIGAIWISTNGHVLTEDIIRFILDSKIDFVNFSAHATSKEVYNSVISSGDYDLVQKNLEMFYRMKDSILKKPFIHCQMIEQEPTSGQVDDFIQKHFKKAEIVSVNMLEYSEFEGNKFSLQRARREPGFCNRIARNDCVIFSNGVVVPCPADYDGALHLGNINESPLYSIWNSEKHLKIVELNEANEINKINFCSYCSDYDL